MKNKVFFFFSIFSILNFFLSESQAQLNFDSPITKMYKMSIEEIDEFLPKFHKQIPDFQNRIRALCHLRLGTPYSWKALGDGSGYEPNPVFRVSKTNCTVQILTNVALASAQSFHQAESLMAYINYYPVADGQNPIHYKNRRHYTSDRLLTSEYFETITTSIAYVEELDSVCLVLNRQKDGSYFLPVEWEKKIVLPYIPQKNISKNLLKRLPPVCGVGIVRKSIFKKGIIIAHEGIILDGITFVHASLAAKKVVSEDFYSYLQKRNKRSGKLISDGIVLYLMKEVKGSTKTQ